VNGRRISDNEIIAAYRAMQANSHARFFRFVMLRLPRPIAQRVVTMMMRRTYKLAMTRYRWTKADLDACFEHVERMRRQRQ